jgi:5,10-methylenetetrahydrofolate reductase
MNQDKLLHPLQRAQAGMDRVLAQHLFDAQELLYFDRRSERLSEPILSR